MDVNLLSPAEKKEVRLIKLYHILKNISFDVVSLIAAVTLVFSFSAIILQNDDASLQQQLDQEAALKQEGRVASLEEATKELNLQLNAARDIQSTYIPWATVLHTIALQIPDGITLTSIQLTDSNKTYRLTGVSSDRQLLLNFEETMKQIPYFSTVNLPVSNLTQREDIPFEISGTLSEKLYE
ncbi:MAG: PilN domain-containing protein [Patescibacteria group bacterium]